MRILSSGLNEYHVGVQCEGALSWHGGHRRARDGKLHILVTRLIILAGKAHIRCYSQALHRIERLCMVSDSIQTDTPMQVKSSTAPLFSHRHHSAAVLKR